jgi:MFS family permease
LTYTLSALLGATYVVKRIGSRNALMGGMTLYVAYVGCFVVALHVEQAKLAAYTGAAIGGTGAGVLWTAQGAYFGQAAEAHARASAKHPVVIATSTSLLAGIFAFWYLSAEVCLRLLSTVLLELKIASWEGIFGMYTLITILSAVAMLGVHEYPITTTPTEATSYVDHKNRTHNKRISSSSTWYKVTAAAQLMIRDPKMKYMIGLNAVFGFSSAFLNTYVNGEVVPIALNDPDSKYIGVLSSWGSAVAAGMSLWFGKCQAKGLILMVGAACFMGVALFFVILPDPHSYSWTLLLGVYSLQGIGRATFEGTLKAVFADYFCHEKEGAFANIVVQNGFASAIGYICEYCIFVVVRDACGPTVLLECS